jgi:hypothetical protein
MHDPNIREIKPGPRDAITISLDGDDWDDPTTLCPVLLFTPNLKKTHIHYHIELTKSEAKVLSDWLVDYLHEVK